MFNSNSNRGFASSRKAPCIRLVTIETPGLLDPVGRHALMFGFDDNCSPTRLYRSFERIRDLRGPAFLNLQSTRIGFDDACNLADPFDTPVRQVRNVCLTDNRHDMMLAVRHELDISQDHHFVISVRFFEGALQIRRRIDVIASENSSYAFATRRGVSTKSSPAGSSPAHKRSFRTASSAASRLTGAASVCTTKASVTASLFIRYCPSSMHSFGPTCPFRQRD